MTQQTENTENNKSSRLDVFADRPVEVKIRTKKMMMYLVIFAVIMLFSGLTSIILVMNAKNYWVSAFPPGTLWISNLLIVLSSLTLFMALRFARKNQTRSATLLITLTFLLGIGFSISQTIGWNQLTEKGMGVSVVEDENGHKAWHWNTLDQMTGTYGKDYVVKKNGMTLNFINGEYYLPTDIQHVNPVSGQVRETFNASGAMTCVLIFLHISHLCLGLIYLLVLTFRSWKGRINSGNWISLHAGGMYWHFMGILWLYLFAFIFYIQ